MTLNRASGAGADEFDAAVDMDVSECVRCIYSASGCRDFFFWLSYLVRINNVFNFFFPCSFVRL